MIYDDIARRLQEGDEDQVPRLVSQALAHGLAPEEVLEKGLIAGMNAVGVKFREREVFLPDVLLAAKAMHAGISVLKPKLAQEGLPARGKVVIGTVQGDLHDIGKNLVAIMLKGAGFEVVDLGKDVPPERFAEAAEKEGAAFVGLSALLTTTMPVMAKVVEALRSRGLGGKVKVMVGGAPVTQDYAREIGADLYAFDAASAVERAQALARG
ncbi:MAG: corrinoid protein [Elusimicrobia bacterium]|nr:corrinoid protein [Elusimicrobiota bacterium]